MAWRFGKKQVSPALTQLQNMDDGEINKLLRENRTAFKNAKELRKATEDKRRPIEGEKGMAALLAGLQGGGTGNKNHKNIPVSDRVHPSRRQAEIDKAMKKAKGADLADLQAQDRQLMLSRIRQADGDRRAQLELRAEAQRKGYL